jgi:hypothetical protein
MKVNSHQKITKKEETQLIKSITPHVTGLTFKDNIKIPIGKKTFNCFYQGATKTIVVKEITTPKNTKAEKLADLISAKKVIKKGNWYQYNGKNYLGKQNIFSAL